MYLPEIVPNKQVTNNTQTQRQVMDPDMNHSINESAAAHQARHNLSIDLDLNPEDPK